MSFNLALSDSRGDYEGGGTRVWDAGEVEANREKYWEVEKVERAKEAREAKGEAAAEAMMNKKMSNMYEPRVDLLPVEVRGLFFWDTQDVLV